jgi:hypothetical protein
MYIIKNYKEFVLNILHQLKKLKPYEADIIKEQIDIVENSAKLK